MPIQKISKFHMARRVLNKFLMLYKPPHIDNMDDDTIDAEEEERPPVVIQTNVPRVSLQPSAVATLPSGTRGDRRALLGALFLLEASTTWSMTVSDLVVWFDEYLVIPGFMRRPARVYEHGTLHVYLERSVIRPSQEVTLRNMLNVTRKEVCAVLEGFVEVPHDDRFLTFFVATTRVSMSQSGIKSYWRPQPRHTDRLSDIVLSLLAADILSNRRLYEDRLSVCNECGRLSFRQNQAQNQICPKHGRPVLDAILRAG
jgi:hypothetical protein